MINRSRIRLLAVPGKLPTCYGLIADLSATRPTSPQQVVVMEFGKRHDATHTTEFCPRPNLLRTCYGETGVMDFGLYGTSSAAWLLIDWLIDWLVQIWVSWRKRNVFDMEWLAEEKRKGEDLAREKWRHVEEHMRITAVYQQRLQGNVFHIYSLYTWFTSACLLFKLRRVELYNETPSQSCVVSVTCHMRSHSVTCQAASQHKWTHPVLTPARQECTRFTYPGGMEGWVD